MITVLDCTFRDGGYYNKWNFSASLVQKYLHAIDSANIEVIELGFRNLPQNQFLGAFAYTKDSYIDQLRINSGVLVAVMIDASSILNSSFSIDKSIDILFQKKEVSRVDIVRIATHFDCVEQCKEIVAALKKLGYKVILNLMQSHDKSNDELTLAAKLIQSWNTLDVLYFADSLGSMNDADVLRIISALKLNWTGVMGFHAHNNKGLAVFNTLTAIENGVDWVDCTILGMGRGAGNAQTENLLLELDHKYDTNYIPDALFDLVLTDFTPLQKQYQWGESLLYSLAAKYSIHPTYVQEMLSDNRYSNREALQAVKFMASLDARNYDKDLILQARGNSRNKGSWSAKDWCKNQDVLILGPGESINLHHPGIIQYIKDYRPIVVSLNFKNHSIFQNLIDVYAASNESSMLGEFSFYSNTDKPLAISNVLLEKVLGRPIKIKSLWDYGLNIEQDSFIINERECTLPYELSLGYALALVNAGRAKSISIVGLDGYDRDDIRQIRMNELIALYSEQKFVPIVALTPTNYDVEQGSIYSGKL